MKAIDLSVVALEIRGGTVELNAANDIDFVDAEGGTIILGNPHALGVGNIITTNTALVFSANETFHNVWGLGGTARLAATAGHTVNMAGNFSFKDAAVTFGDDGDTGTVKIAGKTFSATGTTTIDIASGTVIGGGNAADLAAGQMLASASALNIESGATLDIRNFGANVTLDGLTGTGTVLSRGNHMTLTNTFFGGMFSGNPVITADGTNIIYGIGTFGHAIITMGAGTDELDLVQAGGKSTISAPSGAAASVHLGPFGQAVFFTDFSEGHVSILVSGGQGDHITYSAGSGFERLAVHLGGGEVDNLYLYGVTSPSQVHIGDDGHRSMVITYAAAEIAAHQSFVPMPHDGLF